MTSDTPSRSCLWQIIPLKIETQNFHRNDLGLQAHVIFKYWPNFADFVVQYFGPRVALLHDGVVNGKSVVAADLTILMGKMELSEICRPLKPMLRCLLILAMTEWCPVKQKVL